MGELREEIEDLIIEANCEREDDINSMGYVDQILSLVRERIKKVDNYYRVVVSGVMESKPSEYDKLSVIGQVRMFGMSEGFEEARQAILRTLE